MSGPTNPVELFQSALGEAVAESEEAFGARCTEQLMRNVGFSSSSVKSARESFDSEFGLDWFNEHFLDFPYTLGVLHLREFDLLDLLRRPTRTEVWKVFRELLDWAETEEKDAALIFNVPHEGLWVIHNTPVLSRADRSVSLIVDLAQATPTAQVESIKTFGSLVSRSWHP